MSELWTELSEAAHAPLSPEQHEQLSRYLDLLFEANRTMNLTRIVDRPSAEVQHVGDALTVLRYLPPGEARVADVGSGGGVPGIPLAIARPDAQFLLLESTKKKAAFLQRAVVELGLTNVRVSDARAEDAGRDRNLRESFDAVVARAVGAMDWLAEWCLPLLKRGGVMLAMKGPKAAEELPLAEHAIKILGGSSPDVHPADLPGARHHVIVEIRKTGKTPSTYPRAATASGGKPLR
ncbi:MAG TPA: 16S rRNA (guanine(527)-N(7))-methyltransferase RsmG [Tepidisphaeraceae bacterium]|jgi:16S rRNA (guanine527-N7)-methyltransferase